MSENQPRDPDYTFFEIVKVYRRQWWHWSPDVTIIYTSQDMEFTIKGGCKVKDTLTSNYRKIKILQLGNDEHRIFEIKRRRGGVYEMITDGYWLTDRQRFRV